MYCGLKRALCEQARSDGIRVGPGGLLETMSADSAAAALMSAGRVDVAVVGAIRVAANGDTANKIGTYSLAVNAAHHGYDPHGEQSCGFHF